MRVRSMMVAGVLLALAGSAGAFTLQPMPMGQALQQPNMPPGPPPGGPYGQQQGMPSGPPPGGQYGQQQGMFGQGNFNQQRFDQRKAQIEQRIEQRLSCVQAAQSPSDLVACRPQRAGAQ